MSDATDVEVALAAAAAGAAVVRGLYGADLDHLEKSPTDFATEADVRAEQAIRREIAAARPRDAFEGEETGTTEGPSGRRWLVDPLCGTLNFAAGIAVCGAAGCVLTDLAGDPLHTGRGLIVAADETTHERLLGLVAPHLEAVTR